MLNGANSPSCGTALTGNGLAIGNHLLKIGDNRRHGLIIRHCHLSIKLRITVLKSERARSTGWSRTQHDENLSNSSEAQKMKQKALCALI